MEGRGRQALADSPRLGQRARARPLHSGRVSLSGKQAWWVGAQDKA